VKRKPPRVGKVVEETLNTLLVDGNALFKTGFFGASSEFNTNGVHVGGIYQFITVLRKLLTDNLYHQVYVFWDGSLSGKLRWEFYPEYKCDRNKDFINGTHPVDQEEVRQKVRISKYLDELFIRQIMDDIVESDDYIAYYCLSKKEYETVTIVTNDADMAQLINPDIQIYYCNPQIKNYVTTQNFNTYFDYHIENAALMKTLIGDVSDSIRGVKRLGAPTLLNHFPELTKRKVTIEEILISADEQQQARLSNKKKPLAVLDHILRGVTTTKNVNTGEIVDLVLGMELYDRNWKLVNLKEPMMTETGLSRLEAYLDAPLDPDGRGVKNAYSLIIEDGIDKIIGEHRFSDYLVPFKKLMNRERKKLIEE
jgi:5'-3' exonuclease